MRFATKAIRVAQDPESDYGSATMPIYQTSTYVWKDLDSVPEIDYSRVQNPNRQVLEQVIAALENGTHCTLFGSGMAAIAAAFSLLKAGDHILIATDIYGGTFRLGEDILPRQGIEVSHFDAAKPEEIPSHVRPNTKMLIFESPTNPNLRIMDIRKVVAAVAGKDIITVFDNTFASPALQNPLDLGVDLIVHSTTKYIAGHSDLVGGATVTKREDLGKAMYEWNKNIGSIPSPFDCWLTLRGIKSLSVRMERHCSNAQAVAEYLVSHPKVAKVYFPGLPDHPDYNTAKSQMSGFGGMVTFEVKGGYEQVAAVANNTKVFLLAESLGGIESLLAYPVKMSHAAMTPEARVKAGITETMIRLSIGIEDPQDLIEDLAQALEKA